MSAEMYSLFGFECNPFHQALNDNLPINKTHANFTIDDELAEIKKKVYFKKVTAVVSLIGEKGFGKTERVKVAEKESELNQIRHVSFNCADQSDSVSVAFVDLILSQTDSESLFSNDSYVKTLKKKQKKLKHGRFDPVEIGRLLGAVCAKITPFFICIDDLHLVYKSKDAEKFLVLLENFHDHLPLGSMVLLTGNSLVETQILAYHSGLNRQITDSFQLTRLSVTEAKMMLKKTIESCRIVDGLGETYPFNEDIIQRMVEESDGVAERFLQLAEVCLNVAIDQKAVMIRDLIVDDAMDLLQKKDSFHSRSEGVESVSNSFDSTQSDEKNMGDAEEKGKKLLLDEKNKKAQDSDKNVNENVDSDGKKDLNKKTMVSSSIAGFKARFSGKNKKTTDKDNSRVITSIQSSESKNNTKSFPSDEKVNRESDVKTSDQVKQNTNFVDETEEEDVFEDDSNTVINEDDVESSNLKDSTVEEKIESSKVDQMVENDKKQNFVNPASFSNEKAEIDTRILTLKCPECQNIFTIEMSKNETELACPFCDFNGSL